MLEMPPPANAPSLSSDGAVLDGEGADVDDAGSALEGIIARDSAVLDGEGSPIGDASTPDACPIVSDGAVLDGEGAPIVDAVRHLSMHYCPFREASTHVTAVPGTPRDRWVYCSER